MLIVVGQPSSERRTSVSAIEEQRFVQQFAAKERAAAMDLAGLPFGNAAAACATLTTALDVMSDERSKRGAAEIVRRPDRDVMTTT